MSIEVVDIKDEAIKSVLREVWLWRGASIIFLILSVCAVCLSLRNAKPLVCDDVIRYEDGSIVCEVNIGENND